MSSAIPVHVALVDDTGKIPQAELAAAAGALNEQIQADFAPIWHVRATVGVYAQAPPNTWAVLVQDKLDEPGALGYHTDENHVPISYVQAGADWTVTASHEVLEMLADPWGNRMHRARVPAGLEDKWRDMGLAHEHSYVHYLLEVCDPPEAASYEVGGVALSDFLLPGWYRSNPLMAPAYSHLGTCLYPREVARGGYVSFAVGNHWFQAFNWDGAGPELSDLGTFDASAFPTIREWTDQNAREAAAKRERRQR